MFAYKLFKIQLKKINTEYKKTILFKMKCFRLMILLQKHYKLLNFYNRPVWVIILSLNNTHLLLVKCKANIIFFFWFQEEQDTFVFDEEKVGSKNLMDKWILSFTQSLLGYVRREMAAYRLYSVVPRLVKFIDNLTNWYVRMNRRRLKVCNPYCILKTFY